MFLVYICEVIKKTNIMKKYLIQNLKNHYRTWLSAKSNRNWDMVLEYRKILNEKFFLSPNELDILQIQA